MRSCSSASGHQSSVLRQLLIALISTKPYGVAVEAASERMQPDAVEVVHEIGRNGDFVPPAGTPSSPVASHWQRDLLPLLERLGAARARAFILGRIAEILRQRGQLDGALP